METTINSTDIPIRKLLNHESDAYFKVMHDYFLSACTNDDRERKIQEAQAQQDFPEFFSPEYFAKCTYWVVEIEGKMLGGIGLKPDKEDHSIEWINGFALDPSLRGKGIG